MGVEHQVGVPVTLEVAGRTRHDRERRIALDDCQTACEVIGVQPVVVGQHQHELGLWLCEQPVEVADRSEVARLTEIAYASVALDVLPAHRLGVVLRGVVGDQKLEVRSSLGKHGLDRAR